MLLERKKEIKKERIKVIREKVRGLGLPNVVPPELKETDRDRCYPDIEQLVASSRRVREQCEESGSVSGRARTRAYVTSTTLREDRKRGVDH